MGIESKHKISFSRLPARFSDAKAATHVLQWDRKMLTERLKFLLHLLCEEPTHLHVEFLDGVSMGALNWQFRGKGIPTDVLSFPPHRLQLQMESGAAVASLGELAVCVEVCAAQAKRHRCTLAQEIERMLVHGVVHLKGLDHERSEVAFRVMTALEKALRQSLVSSLGEPKFCGMASDTRVRRASQGARR
jgi:probable rRNA maturation factor